MDTQERFTEEQLYRKDNLERLKAFRPIDDIMFRAMIRDNIPLAEYMLRVFLGDPDIKVRKLDVQADMKLIGGARSLVFDVYATDRDCTKYDLEIQKDLEGAGPRRARYHASVMDEQNSHPGEDFADLNDIYVIFVTETDIVGEGFALTHNSKNSPILCYEVG